MRSEVSEELREGIDRLSHQLDERGREARDELERLKHELSAGVHAKQEAMAHRVRRLEGRVQILKAKAEIARAQRMADKSEFVAAEDLLEEAVVDVREVRAKLGEEGEEDPAFADVITSLHHAIRSVRVRAEDTRRTIDQVLSNSDLLLASLEDRQRAA